MLVLSIRKSPLFVISERLDILALTETWTSSQLEFNIAIAEVTNTLQGYEFLHLLRPSRGGDIGVLLKKGYDIKENPVASSLEFMDISVLSHKLNFMPSRPNSNTLSETTHRFTGQSNHKHHQLVFFLEVFSQLSKGRCGTSFI